MRIVVAGGLALALMLYVTAWFPSGDAARIQGNWAVVAVEDSGVLSNEPFLKTRQYAFDGRKMIVRARGAAPLSWERELVERFFKFPSFRLNPTASPKEIDLLLPRLFDYAQHVHDIDGDCLWICFSGPSGKAAMSRPRGFSGPRFGCPPSCPQTRS